MMKVINGILCFLLLVSVGLQYNDPDPLLWMLIYAYGAVMTGMAMFRRYYVPALYIGIGFCLCYAAALVPAAIEYAKVANQEALMQPMRADKMFIEETREFGGLLICAASMVFVWFQAKRENKIST